MQRFNISIPDELVLALDAAAAADYTSRSEFIRQAVLEKLAKQPKTSVVQPVEKSVALKRPVLNPYQRPSANR